MPSLTRTPTWKSLVSHCAALQNFDLREAFDLNPRRFEQFSLHFNDILFDYSKNLITEDTRLLLVDLATDSALSSKIEAMFTGEKINHTEQRAVLHTALRNRSNHPVMVDGVDVMPSINQVLAKMRIFTDKVRREQWLGHTGKPVKDIVNIGIGGSNLGPKMVATALTPYASDKLNVHFVSNVDQTRSEEHTSELQSL